MIIVQGVPDPRYGIICPKCGCRDWRVMDSVALPNGNIRRYRVCRHCGKRIRTIERIDPKAV